MLPRLVLNSLCGEGWLWTSESPVSSQVSACVTTPSSPHGRQNPEICVCDMSSLPTELCHQPFLPSALKTNNKLMATASLFVEMLMAHELFTPPPVHIDSLSLSLCLHILMTFEGSKKSCVIYGCWEPSLSSVRAERFLNCRAISVSQSPLLYTRFGNSSSTNEK